MSVERRIGKSALSYAAVFFGSLSMALPISAHEGGHGAAIAGHGSEGGKLVAVVSAKEADLGAKAKILALAEWKRDGNELRVNLLDLERKPLAAKPQGPLKWILLGGQGKKPKIMVTPPPPPGKAIQASFSSLKGITSVELIMPPGFPLEEKSVLVLRLP